jgi:hypothetical protein
MHLFGHICDHDYYFKLLRKEEQDAAINYSVLYFSAGAVQRLAKEVKLQARFEFASSDQTGNLRRVARSRPET